MNESAAETVERLLHETEPIGQDNFAEHVDEMTELSEDETLRAVRRLMQDNRVSYNLDWELQTEIEGDTDE